MVGELKKAQVETDHYTRKVKTLREKGERQDKIAGNEAKLQQAIADEERLQKESMVFLAAFLRSAPKDLFAANLELLFAQDEFSKTLNECAKFHLENPPAWMQQVCRYAHAHHKSDLILAFGQNLLVAVPLFCFSS